MLGAWGKSSGAAPWWEGATYFQVMDNSQLTFFGLSTRPRAPAPEGFAALLRETTGLPVTLWDERRTTVDAHNILMAGGKNAKQRKKTVDAVAASLMLEGYLTFKKRQK